MKDRARRISRRAFLRQAAGAALAAGVGGALGSRRTQTQAQEIRVRDRGRSYYVDAVRGDDGNAGVSAGAPWRTLEKVNATTFAPGDHILLRAGCRWSGQLWPKGSGEAGRPIVVDRYGEGPKPAIAGGGRAFEAVHLRNQQHWEIANLEVTNTCPQGPAPRAGVRVLGEDAGVLSHVHLRALEVHDVNGHLRQGRDSGKCNAGILFDVEGRSAPTRFHDVLIEGCSVRACDRSAIKTWSDWGRYAHGDDWQPYTGLVIRGNVVDDIGGDGIIACMADAPLIEHNVASNCNRRSGDYNVAIWVWETDDALMQFNEAYLTRTTKDGQGFDVDGLSRRTIVQYNYSHDNEGGFILLCEEGDPSPRRFNDGAIVRYNLSVNDGARIFQVGGKVTNAHIYNNTIYVGQGRGDPLMVWHNRDRMWPDGIRYSNNIFYNLGQGGFDLGRSTGVVFDHNVFYGGDRRTEPEDAHKITEDPRLMEPGEATSRERLEGLQLRADSPCVDSGLTIPDHGGRCYWGNPVPSGAGPDRGAHERPAQ